MVRVTLDPEQPDLQVLERAADIVRAGGVVAYPTDTLYGLAADPHSTPALQRLFRVKQRPPERAVPLIAADTASAEGAGRWTPLACRLARRFWPGPLTLIVAADPALAPAVHGGTGRVGVRVPASAVARALARACGGLITATSANFSGSPGSSRPEPLLDLVKTGLDLLLDAGPSPGGAPSSLVDVSGERPVLVRAGAIAWERVLEFLDTKPPD